MQSFRLRGLGLVSIALVFSGTGTLRADEPTLADQVKVGKKFQSSCMLCHRQPYLEFASDRAWLRQIKDTA